jgi:hypothetical protein
MPTVATSSFQSAIDVALLPRLIESSFLCDPVPCTGLSSPATGLDWNGVCSYGRLFRVARTVLIEWRRQAPSHFVWTVTPVMDSTWWRWPTDWLAPLAGSAILFLSAILVGICAQFSESAASSNHRKVELSIESAVLVRNSAREFSVHMC